MLPIWNAYHNGLVLLALALAFFLGSLIPLIALPLLSFSWIIKKSWQSKPIHAANVVTFTRLLVAMLALILPIAPWIIGILLVISLAGDGLDGYLARKLETASLLGSYLDMESDALILLLMAFYLHHSGNFFWPCIIIGAARPVSVLLREAFFAKPLRERRSRWGRGIFFVNYISLGLMVVWTNGYTALLAAISALALMGSFFLDFRYFHKQTLAMELEN